MITPLDPHHLIIALLVILLLIQTSRAAYHKGARANAQAIVIAKEEQIEELCEEITYQRQVAERHEHRLLGEPTPEPED